MPVEINEERNVTINHFVQFVAVVFKERRLGISRLDRAPMLVLPFQTVVNPDVFERNFTVLLSYGHH